MNLKELSEIINSDRPEEVKKAQIIYSLSNDEDVIPDMLQILENERAGKKQLITDMNLELSRAHIFIDSLHPHMLVNKKVKEESELGPNVTKSWMNDNIAAFYIKYKGVISHCFNRFIE